MKFQKIINMISIVTLAGILLLSGILFGMQNERARLKEQEQEEVVTYIAVVNLDEGVFEEGKKVFYSTELMNLEAEYLVSENLEAARQGIYNGNYAAYVIIPAEFSKNATSINSVPEKAILEYAINPNLREDVSRLTMSNIKNFEISLNTNMSYMYVQAVLSEFHDVQDKSGLIMDNDNQEMERILAVDAQALLEKPEYTQVDQIDPNIEELDFDEAFDKNSEIIDDLNENYESFVTEGEEAFGTIKEGEGPVLEQVEEFYEVVAQIDVEKDDEGNIVYEEGLEALKEYLKEYDRGFDSQKLRVKSMLSELGQVPDVSENEVSDNGVSDNGISGNDTSVNNTQITATVPQVIKENIEASLSEANRKISTCNSNNKQIVETMKTQISAMRTILSGQTGSEDTGEVSGNETADDPETQELLSKLDEMEAALNQFQEMSLLTLEEVYNAEVVKNEFMKISEEVDKLPKVDVQEYADIFEKKVLTPIKEEAAAENQKVQEAGTSMTEIMDEYLNELGGFNPYDYYDYEKMNELLTEFGDNIFDLEDKIYETHTEYEDFVYNAVELTNESMLTWQGELEEAYNDTADNVSEEVSLAKAFRKTINEINIDILGSFKDKLSYTRVGQLEYVQAYDFMVNPIKMSDTSIEKDRTLIWQDYNALKVVLIGLIIIWGSSICALLILQMRSYRAEGTEKE